MMSDSKKSTVLTRKERSHQRYEEETSTHPPTSPPEIPPTSPPPQPQPQPSSQPSPPPPPSSPPPPSPPQPSPNPLSGEEPTMASSSSSASVSSSLSVILDSDEKLLFNLKILGSIQKNEKLLIRDDFLSVDDRWIQSVRRWYDGNNRYQICDTIFQGVTSSCKRVNELLDEHYRYEHPESSLGTNQKTLYDEKKNQEEHAICRSKIQEFFLSLSLAKQGIENQRETYTDKFSQTKLNLALDKLNSLVERLKTVPL